MPSALFSCDQKLSQSLLVFLQALASAFILFLLPGGYQKVWHCQSSKTITMALPGALAELSSIQSLGLMASHQTNNFPNERVSTVYKHLYRVKVLAWRQL